MYLLVLESNWPVPRMPICSPNILAIDSRYVNVGLFYLRQIFYSDFDVKVHSGQEPEDYTALWNELHESIALVKIGKPAPGHGTLAHLVGGYDVGLYGYGLLRVSRCTMHRLTRMTQIPVLARVLGGHVRDGVQEGPA